MSQKRRNDKKKRKGGAGAREPQEKLWVTTESKSNYVCPVCQKPIRELYTAIASENEDRNPPVHFECAIAQLSETENLGPREKIQYLGSGYFGVVEEIPKTDEHPLGFVVKRKIQAEKTEYKHPWRESMKRPLPEEM